ncbi:MAG: DUF1269 domain-containing protein [Actinomycetes bacterium]
MTTSDHHDHHDHHDHRADHGSDGQQVLVGISFDDPFRAAEFLTASHRLAAHHGFRLLDAVVVRKDEHGKTFVQETTDPQPVQAGMSGAVWAGLFGLLLGGPVGWLAGAAVGAGAGAIAAKVMDTGIPDAWVGWFRDAVADASTTVALLVSDLDRDALVAEVARFQGGSLVYANVDPIKLARLREALASGTTD